MSVLKKTNKTKASNLLQHSEASSQSARLRIGQVIIRKETIQPENPPDVGGAFTQLSPPLSPFGAIPPAVFFSPPEFSSDITKTSTGLQTLEMIFSLSLTMISQSSALGEGSVRKQQWPRFSFFFPPLSDG